MDIFRFKPPGFAHTLDRTDMQPVVECIPFDGCYTVQRTQFPDSPQPLSEQLFPLPSSQPSAIGQAPVSSDSMHSCMSSMLPGVMVPRNSPSLVYTSKACKLKLKGTSLTVTFLVVHVFIVIILSTSSGVSGLLGLSYVRLDGYNIPCRMYDIQEGFKSFSSIRPNYSGRSPGADNYAFFTLFSHLTYANIRSWGS